MYTLITAPLDAPPSDCDLLGETPCGVMPHPIHEDRVIRGVSFFARGATGRVYEVLRTCACHASTVQTDPVSLHDNASTLEEVQAWAESEPNGWLDY